MEITVFELSVQGEFVGWSIFPEVLTVLGMIDKRDFQSERTVASGSWRVKAGTHFAPDICQN
jgi:hypothetical protein